MNRKRKLIPVLVITCLIFCSWKDSKKPPKASPKKIIIASVFSRTSTVSRKTDADIIPFAVFENGKYKAINCSQEDTVPVECECRTVLNKYPAYAVFYKGLPVANATAQNIVLSNYDCFETVCGKSVFDFRDQVYEKMYQEAIAIKKTYTPEDTSRLEDLNGSFIGISGKRDIPSADTGVISIFKPGKLQEKRLRSIVKERMEIMGKHPADTSIQIKDIYQLDLNKDGIPEYITSVGYGDSTGYICSLVFFHIWDGKISPFYMDETEMEPDSWGEGFDFFDALDVDGDGIKEIFIQTSGYEDTGMNIYSFRDGKVKLLLSSWLFGC
jgi:hypothetical protein